MSVPALLWYGNTHGVFASVFALIFEDYSVVWKSQSYNIYLGILVSRLPLWGFVWICASFNSLSLINSILSTHTSPVLPPIDPTVFTLSLVLWRHTQQILLSAYPLITDSVDQRGEKDRLGAVRWHGNSREIIANAGKESAVFHGHLIIRGDRQIPLATVPKRLGSLLCEQPKTHKKSSGHPRLSQKKHCYFLVKPFKMIAESDPQY